MTNDQQSHVPPTDRDIVVSIASVEDAKEHPAKAEASSLGRKSGSWKLDARAPEAAFCPSVML